jgi:hypothetical protein
MENSNYIFLKETDGENIYYAISPERIETLNVADTYDSYGQQVGHYNAGDYHFDNSESSCQDDCCKAIQEKFQVGVCLDGEMVSSIDNEEADDYQNFIEVDDEGADEHNKMVQLIIDINEFISEWREENESLNTCQGFNYWDGHNWKTVITSFEYDGYPSHEIIDDEELIQSLNQAIESKEYVKSGFGFEEYEFEDWKIIDSHFEGTWAAYEITEKEEEEAY